MIKAIVLCKRHPHKSSEEFREWFIGAHATGVMNLAGDLLERCTFSFVESAGPGADPWPNGEPPYDVISEFWVPDRATYHEAYEVLQSGGEMGNAVKNMSIRIPVMAEEYVLIGDK